MSESAAPSSQLPSQAHESAWRATLWLVAGVSLLHLLVIGRFELGVDEAHYALYGIKPDWSYFDHPPMVGWMQSLMLVFSETDWILRLWPLFISAGASLYLHRLAQRLFPDISPWVGTVSVALLQSAIIFQLISMALVPEAPLLLFGIAAVYYIYGALREGKVRDWMLAGLFLGLAGLSKYTAITLVFSALLFVAIERLWHRLANPWPWIAGLLALLIVAPVLYWNVTHDWLSFRYQLGHGVPDREWQWGRFGLAQAGQLLAYSPGIYLFGMVAIVSGIKHSTHSGVRYLLAMGVPLLLLFGWGAGFEETLPHWTLLAWAMLAPLTARWLIQYWERRWVRIGAWFSIVYSLLLGLIIHSVLLTPWLPFKEHQHPLGDLIGWKDAAVRAGEIYDALPTVHDRKPVLFIGNWSLASRIAWYARPRPVQVIDERYDQFDLWYGSPEAGAWGVLIVPEKFHERPELSGVARFDSCEEKDILPVKLNETAVHTFRFYLCEGYRE